MSTTPVVTCLFLLSIFLLHAAKTRNNESYILNRDIIKTSLPALFVGCGYSGTGFLSRVYSDAGYPIGHECDDTLGRSDWRHSFRNDSHNLYRYIFVTVRHPLAVVNSCRATSWLFEIEFEYDRHVCMNADLTLHPSMHASAPHYKTTDKLRVVDFVPSNVQNAWNHLPRDVKTLEWWYQATTRALRKGHFWFQIETFNEHTAVHVCELLHLESCEKPDWTYIIDSRRGYNQHNPSTMNLTSLTVLQESVSCDNTMCDVIASVFERAKVLCLQLGYSHC